MKKIEWQKEYLAILIGNSLLFIIFLLLTKLSIYLERVPLTIFLIITQLVNLLITIFVLKFLLMDKESSQKEHKGIITDVKSLFMLCLFKFTIKYDNEEYDSIYLILSKQRMVNIFNTHRYNGRKITFRFSKNRKFILPDYIEVQGGQCEKNN